VSCFSRCYFDLLFVFFPFSFYSPVSQSKRCHSGLLPLPLFPVCCSWKGDGIAMRVAFTCGLYL